MTKIPEIVMACGSNRWLFLVKVLNSQSQLAVTTQKIWCMDAKRLESQTITNFGKSNIPLNSSTSQVMSYDICHYSQLS